MTVACLLYLRAFSDTPTGFQGLPLVLWRLDQLECCRTSFAAKRLSPPAHERVPVTVSVTAGAHPQAGHGSPGSPCSRQRGVACSRPAQSQPPPRLSLPFPR